MPTTFNAKGKTRAEFANEILEAFDEGIQNVYQSEQWLSWLDFNSKFHNYSARNLFLVFMQNPNVTSIASMSKWNELGRNVIKGQGTNGLKIWAPTEFKRKVTEPKKDDKGNPVLDEQGKQVHEEVIKKELGFIPVSVYDVSQTEGEPIPQPTQILTGENQNVKSILAALEKVSGIPFQFEAMSEGQNGYFFDNGTDKKIAIKENLPDEQTIKTAIHETAHALLHNQATKLENSKDRMTKEVEAESVAYIVCKTFGVDSSQYTFPYVATWAQKQSLNVLKSSLDTITSTAAKISKEMKLHLRGLNLEKCFCPEAVKTYIDSSRFLANVDDSKFFETYNTKLAQADKLAAQGLFVEVYKSECSELKVGELYSLSDMDSRISILDKMTFDRYQKQGQEKAFDKVYFTLYYPQTVNDKTTYQTLTHRCHLGTGKMKTLTEHIMYFKENQDRLKDVLPTATVSRGKTHRM